MRPNSLLVRAYVVRGAWLWLGTRALLAIMLLLAGGSPLDLGGGGDLLAVALAVGLSFLETHLRGERFLLANLGAHPVMLGALFAAPALAGEIVLGLATAAL
jgi:hypothetical protein